MSLNNVRIGAKLFLAFGFIIVLMIISSSLSLLSLSRANTGMQTIISKDYPTIVKANHLIEYFQESVSTQQLIMLDEQGTYTAASAQRLKALSNNITAIITDLTETLKDEKSQQIIQEYKQIRQQYLESRQRILAFVQNNDRAGAMNEMTTTMLNLQQAYIAKLQELIAVQHKEMLHADEVVERDFVTNRLILILLTLGSVVAAAMTGWLIARSITRPLGQAVSLAESIAEGDLTRAVVSSARDETGVLLNALMKMKMRLQAIVQEVQSGSENISSAAAQIVAGNQDLAARTEEQASSVEQTAASMEQITVTVKNTAEHTGDATHLSADAATAVKSNGEMMKQVTQKMRLINDTASRMSEIINLIDAIAFQTNILALNAAVEAARAGEHGRGFAVVAGEVRQLAQKSATSSREIRQLIESSTSQAQEGMALVEKASGLINGMVGNVEEMDAILREIGQASREQTEGISQINSAIGLIDATTQQNSSLVEESVAAAASLNEQAMQLKALVKVFRIRTEATA